MIARVREIDPEKVAHAAKTQIKKAANRGIQQTHFTFPQIASWFRMSTYDLEGLVHSTRILDYHRDSKGVRWISAEQLLTFMRYLQEMGRELQG